ncbi:MAG: 3'-5' exonuclease [Polyangiales bacterium]
MPETYGEVIRQQVAFRKLRRTIELAEEEAANVAHSATKTPKESQRVLDVAKDDRPARHLADAWNARGHWAKGRIASIDVRTAADGARPTEIGVALFDGGSLVTAKSFPISAKDGLTFDVVMRDVAAFTSADGAPYYPLAYNGVTHRFRLLDALERARSAGGLVDQAELPPLFSAPSYLDPLPWVREMLQSDGPATLEAIAPKLEVSLTNPLNSTERAIAAAQVAFKLEEKGVPRTLGRFLDDQHELRVARIERRPARLNGSGAAAVGVATEDTAPTALSKRIDGKAPWRNGRIVVVDFEATGPNPRSARIIEAGWAIFDDGKLVEKHSVLVDPGVRISDEVSELTGITNEMIKNGDPERGLQPGRPLEEVLPLLNAYWGDAQPVAHNVRYDRTILHAETDRLLESGKITEAPRWGVAFERDADWIDTLPLVKKVFSKGETENHRLGTMVDHMGIQLESWHRAGDDALAAGKLLLKLGERKLRHLSWEDLYALQKMSNKEYIALSEKEQAALRRTADIAAAAKKATAKKKSVAKAAEKVANKRPRN